MADTSSTDLVSKFRGIWQSSDGRPLLLRRRRGGGYSLLLASPLGGTTRCSTVMPPLPPPLPPFPPPELGLVEDFPAKILLRNCFFTLDMFCGLLASFSAFADGGGAATPVVAAATALSLGRIRR